MTPGTVVLEGALLTGVVDRLTRRDYPGFEAQLRSSGYCAQPVRLQGRVEVCDGHGRRQQVWTTDSEPDGILRKACGNRREAVCAPCAERYRRDAYHLIAAGLSGGKGVPDTVNGHPAVFATLTAPGFGVVHAHLLGPDGQPLRCHPRRDRPVCEHGNPVSCSRVHGPDDPCLGEPLCPECFDYEGAVTWNNLLGELWRRTTIYLPRKLAKLAKITQKRLRELVQVSYVKVSEYQHRGLVHLHPIIRLDKRMPDYRNGEIRPPDKRFTNELLEQALRATVAEVKVKIPAELGAGEIRWGDRLDVQQLPADDRERRGKAGYLAKYTTKSTEQAGGLLRRITRDEVDHAPVSEHVRGYLNTGFVLDDRVTKAIAADPLPAPSPRPPVPAPASFRHPNELILRALQAMSTSERVLIRLHAGTEHVGQITRRTPDGLVLDSGHETHEIAVAEGGRSRPPPSNRQSAIRATGGLRRARTPSATAAPASPNPAATRPPSARCARPGPTTSANNCSPSATRRSVISSRPPPSGGSSGLSSSASAISQPPTPTLPLKPPRGLVSTANWRVKRSTTTTAVPARTNARRRGSRRGVSGKGAVIMGEMGRVIEFPRHRRQPEPLLTMRDLVERYQMSERWFRYRLAEGMPAHRWGGRWRFRASEVEAWMEARGAS